MEAKTVVMTVLLLNLVVGQLQVEARAKACCASITTRNVYNSCRVLGGSMQNCASLSGCQIIDGSPCPSGYTNDILEKTGGDAVNEYCKLGCVSSVCGAMTTLRNLDQGEFVNGAVEKCVIACSDLCTKYSIRAA